MMTSDERREFRAWCRDHRVPDWQVSVLLYALDNPGSEIDNVYQPAGHDDWQVGIKRPDGYDRVPVLEFFARNEQ